MNKLIITARGRLCAKKTLQCSNLHSDLTLVLCNLSFSLHYMTECLLPFALCNDLLPLKINTIVKMTPVFENIYLKFILVKCIKYVVLDVQKTTPNRVQYRTREL